MVHYPQFHTKWLHNMNIFITIHEAAQSASGGAENAGLEMQDVKMQDHVEKRRTSEVRHSEQTDTKGNKWRGCNAPTLQSNSSEVGSYGVIGTRCYNIRHRLQSFKSNDIIQFLHYLQYFPTLWS